MGEASQTIEKVNEAPVQGALTILETIKKQLLKIELAKNR